MRAELEQVSKKAGQDELAMQHERRDYWAAIDGNYSNCFFSNLFDAES